MPDFQVLFSDAKGAIIQLEVIEADDLSAAMIEAAGIEPPDTAVSAEIEPIDPPTA